jgi:hypothetical protein
MAGGKLPPPRPYSAAFGQENVPVLKPEATVPVSFDIVAIGLILLALLRELAQLRLLGRQTQGPQKAANQSAPLSGP